MVRGREQRESNMYMARLQLGGLSFSHDEHDNGGGGGGGRNTAWFSDDGGSGGHGGNDGGGSSMGGSDDFASSKSSLASPADDDDDDDGDNNDKYGERGCVRSSRSTTASTREESQSQRRAEGDDGDRDGDCMGTLTRVGVRCINGRAPAQTEPETDSQTEDGKSSASVVSAEASTTAPCADTDIGAGKGNGAAVGQEDYARLLQKAQRLACRCLCRGLHQWRARLRLLSLGQPQPQPQLPRSCQPQTTPNDEVRGGDCEHQRHQPQPEEGERDTLKCSWKRWEHATAATSLLNM